MILVSRPNEFSSSQWGKTMKWELLQTWLVQQSFRWILSLGSSTSSLLCRLLSCSKQVPFSPSVHQTLTQQKTHTNLSYPYFQKRKLGVENKIKKENKERKARYYWLFDSGMVSAAIQSKDIGDLPHAVA